VSLCNTVNVLMPTRTGEYVPSPRLLWQLLQEARGVPILFAAVSSNGTVMLEEFSDASVAVDWTNSLRKDFVFENPLSAKEEHSRCKKLRSRKRKLEQGKNEEGEEERVQVDDNRVERDSAVS
jgi:hypothetical protein